MDDFKMLRDRNGYYIDKSLYIKEIIDDFSLVKLITRPRRFGKTLNLSMLQIS
ncbi:MAG TPA: AAA family ATPase [Bacillota bacterium]|nr:AAA family ATPase [Bacillota bacterium]